MLKCAKKENALIADWIDPYTGPFISKFNEINENALIDYLCDCNTTLYINIPINKKNIKEIFSKKIYDKCVERLEKIEEGKRKRSEASKKGWQTRKNTKMT